MKSNNDKPVEIAQNIYWVGHKLEHDTFQCHAYLIENGKDSILIDPGSKITYFEKRNKISQKNKIKSGSG
ncbi:MAG: hypothetical protein EVJ47_05745 [Candidatus Acidulodesulfobacterium ferriphilum]|jgi:flavorubredoxin|uniref:MBL fold metallo-hydrolase n=1 Tax=Candidatus Acidulodesulfobacterium ferriphilum TaxID=2597223 RepID=A0A519BBT1_9DELT|nr:MAG: hypothetical protein EVJ47_05745 [Candidatus Acidulodesulfobacterium ferriphilum]